ncbi:unnamed protein product [Arabidopsis thaliana]|uniref:Uncharacterized protein n=1 Tax=Arabidopsis thaliana TaxID=3702 RepID=A0A654ESS3_ARATH|nr:unnamed protein product [Arabidopsis thaliana]
MCQTRFTYVASRFPLIKFPVIMDMRPLPSKPYGHGTLVSLQNTFEETSTSKILWTWNFGFFTKPRLIESSVIMDLFVETSTSKTLWT